MKQVRLGNSNTLVSQMALGCLPFGCSMDQDKAFEILDYFQEKGGNFLDTSNNYSFWVEGCNGDESETVLGNWFEKMGNREKFILATKVGARPTNRDKLIENSGTREGWMKYSQGLSKEVILRSVDDSLKRLKTDYIDILYAHIDHRKDSLEETLEAFNSLVESGKVKQIGCSNYQTWRMLQGKTISRKNGWVEYSVIQQFHTYLQANRYSDLGVSVEANEELFDYIEYNKDITLLAYTPLLWGSYTKPEKYELIPNLKNFINKENDRRMEKLKEVAKKKSSSINQIIYAWMMHRKQPVIPLVAVSSIEQLRENLDSVNIQLSVEDMEFLNNPAL